jgi:hypothetical protein
MMIKTIAAAAVAALFTLPALAQTSTPEMVQRNINQQERIQQGLQSGQLSTQEAARLERGQAHVERLESRALRDGKLTPAERARIDHAQDAQSARIYQEKHDAQTGNPNSASSQRMQSQVQRNINQQTRIHQGVQSGELTNREVGRLERGQAHSNRLQARAGADGRVGPRENARIHRAENVQSGRIYREKHDAQKRP